MLTDKSLNNLVKISHKITKYYTQLSLNAYINQLLLHLMYLIAFPQKLILKFALGCL